MSKDSVNDKLNSLRKYNGVNPRPRMVIDELFQTHPFFDPRDLVQVKYEMLRRVEKEGMAVTNATTMFGFSRPSFYQAQSSFKKEGLPGLLPKRRGPRGPHKLTDHVMDFIEQTLREDDSLRARELAKRVEAEFGFSLHPRTIERGLERRQKKRQDTDQ